MPLNINSKVFISCAVTGSGSTQNRSNEVPRSPKEIAESAIAAAEAGASIVHCHVRDPDTGVPSRDPTLYRELTNRIRDSKVDVVLNLTAGMGGDIVFGPPSAPLPLQNGTDMGSAESRMEPIAECLPEICTLDCGTMNFAEADYVMTNTPGMLRAMGSMMTELGVKPEIEAFDTGHLWFAQELAKEGVIADPVLVQLCMGIPWGAPNDLNTYMAMVNNIPSSWNTLKLVWADPGGGNITATYTRTSASTGAQIGNYQYRDWVWTWVDSGSSTSVPWAPNTASVTWTISQ